MPMEAPLFLERKVTFRTVACYVLRITTRHGYAPPLADPHRTCLAIALRHVSHGTSVRLQRAQRRVPLVVANHCTHHTAATTPVRHPPDGASPQGRTVTLNSATSVTCLSRHFRVSDNVTDVH